ncbi:hypothetical protein [Chryseobacterium sp. PMSZPI]|uniref:hypothetical protein n=1 Tax=Chryseobacterium sp. PMSZPI TaxID=1033900 RepID=UPI000C31D105|nr:hypothetical protein [Chryseobacterium sp. PMSZPI]PKF74025.1 hypothetical protein CW752_11510 [Chryseobacterium sp. PMSZPI]
MKRTHNTIPDQNFTESNSTESDRINNKNIFSPSSILTEDDQEIPVNNYRFISHVLMDFDSDSAHEQYVFYEIKEPLKTTNFYNE